MLGRKTYAREELDRARKAVDRRLAAYDSLVEAVAGACRFVQPAAERS